MKPIDESETKPATDNNKVEVMDPKTHHQLSYNPNRKVIAGEDVLNKMIKGLMDEEPDEHGVKPATHEKEKNRLLELNIKTRELDRKQKKFKRRLT